MYEPHVLRKKSSNNATGSSKLLNSDDEFAKSSSNPSCKDDDYYYDEIDEYHSNRNKVRVIFLFHFLSQVILFNIYPKY